jgi:hypothetical protein
LTSFVDALPVECDGSTRLIHLRLRIEGIDHTCYRGNIQNTFKVLTPPHFWVRVGDLIIDYKARMWIGENGPHGVFDAEDRKGFLYAGYPTDLDLRGGLVLARLFDLDFVANL